MSETTPEARPIRIVSIEAENFKRLQAVDITPDPAASTVTVGGPNGAGKSSVLDAIEVALRGKRAMPGHPINDDARQTAADEQEQGAGPARMQIVATLSNGITIRRSKTDGSKSDRLTVESPEGAQYRSPQALLDALYGELTFDPLAFLRMAPKDKRATLLRLIGVDVDALDEDRATIVRGITSEKRELTNLQHTRDAFGAYEDGVPDTPVDTEDLMAQLRRQDEVEDEWRQAQAVVNGHEAARVKATDRIAEIDQQVRALQDERDVLETTAHDKAKDRDNAIEARDAIGRPDPDDRARIQDAIASAGKVNESVARHESMRNLDKRIATAKGAIAEQQAAVDEVDRRKLAALTSATYPVEGLGVDDDGVTWDGRPIEQASQAEQLRASVAIGVEMNPGLGVMLVRDGALLDETSLALLTDLATRHDSQVWIERVGDDGTCAVVMEDGKVVEDRTGQQPATAPQIDGDGPAAEGSPTPAAADADQQAAATAVEQPDQ